MVAGEDNTLKRIDNSVVRRKGNQSMLYSHGIDLEQRHSLKRKITNVFYTWWFRNLDLAMECRRDCSLEVSRGQETIRGDAEGSRDVREPQAGLKSNKGVKIVIDEPPGKEERGLV